MWFLKRTCLWPLNMCVCALFSKFFFRCESPEFMFCRFWGSAGRPAEPYFSPHTHRRILAGGYIHKYTKMWEVSYSHDCWLHCCFSCNGEVRCFFFPKWPPSRRIARNKKVAVVDEIGKKKIKKINKNGLPMCENWRQKVWVIVFMLVGINI